MINIETTENSKEKNKSNPDIKKDINKYRELFFQRLAEILKKYS